jgi:hypothetical protein
MQLPQIKRSRPVRIASVGETDFTKIQIWIMSPVFRLSEGEAKPVAMTTRTASS